MKDMKKWIVLVLVLCMLTACGGAEDTKQGESYSNNAASESQETTISLDDIPAYSGEPYVVLNNNEPNFTEEDMTTDSYEYYSELDKDGKCGMVVASIGQEIMPTQERGSIGQIKPSGWQTVKYDNVDGKYLYNRCHLIGFQLTGENANEKNLITGTRYMNVEGMLPFENMVADYVKETGNHVVYRVTPIFEGDNLVASGVQMEAKSVEDDGEGICFHVYVYNVQPGIAIDYATGESQLANEEGIKEDTNAEDEIMEYILNTNNKKFHEPDCSSVDDMKEENKQEYEGTREQLIEQGYEPCGRCKP